MKAARYYDRGDIRIDEIPEPPVEPGEVGIDVAWCGICGSDLHEYAEGPIFVPPAGHPQPISGESAPITLGHEMSGVVSAVGEGVTDLAVGDHVVVEPYIVADDVDTGPDSRSYHLSKDMSFIGLGGRGGGLGEKISVKRRWVHKIADSVPLDQAALIAALRERRIGGAFLDTVTPEPLPADDPLWAQENCLITMHLSGRSQTGMAARAAELFLANLDAFLAGRPMRNVADLGAGY